MLTNLGPLGQPYFKPSSKFGHSDSTITIMAPILVSFVGCPVSLESMEQYSKTNELPISSNRRLLQHLESKINLPLALVCVDQGDVDQYYLCCFADCSGRPYDTRELLAIVIPHAFDQLRKSSHLNFGDLHRLVVSRATYSSYDQSGKIREGNRIGGGHV